MRTITTVQKNITIQKMANIPASRRATVDVDSCPLCERYKEPNAATIAAFEEGDAMLRGEKPAVWHHSIEDLDKMLGL
ncbi:MAG: hypothetical protein Ta2G_10950 [Termitinemataceae bacterium]|nr:MAG: hypothetical protein Ta2G_10950 [Termitinemataceae bacterium]